MNIAPSAPSAGLTALGMSNNAAAGPPPPSPPGNGSSASFGALIATVHNGATMDVQAAQNTGFPAIAADRLGTGEMASIPNLPEIMSHPLETDLLENTAMMPAHEGAPTAGQGDKAMALVGRPANAAAPQLAAPLVDAMAPEDGTIAVAADPGDVQEIVMAEDFQPAVADMESASVALIPDNPDEAVPSAAPIDLLPPTPVAVTSLSLHQPSPSSTPMPAAEFGEANLSTPTASAAIQAMGAGEASGRGAPVAENMAMPAGPEAAPGAADLPDGLPASLISQALPGASARSAGVDQLYGGMPAAAPHLPVATARPGQIGREMGVEIARQISAGKEELCVRLDPAELGRIDVRMSFERDGGLRAVVTAESSVALDMLRRDAADLTRALVDAGVRADSGSFRFDGRSGDGQRGQSQAEQGGGERGRGHASTPDEEIPQYRRLATSGRVDMMA